MKDSKPEIKKNHKKTELLSPAGNMACVRAAVQNGADSIYLGLKNFGARSYAVNFSREELAQAIDYCHLRDVKVYLTLNTLLFDQELQAALEEAVFAANVGIDGFIVQDVGFILLLHRYLPQVELHLSTQASAHNLSGFFLAEAFGCVRAVAARELTSKEIRKICEASPIETEIFVHGAQCYCFSGMCLMSSVYGNRSGNRGRCAGPCRLPYELVDSRTGKSQEKGYLLSPVDMCLGLDMEEVIQTGADCLKIEGRMKGPDYVAATAALYRKALDTGEKFNQADLLQLENAFSRGGFTNGMFLNRRNRFKKQESNDDAYRNQQKDLLVRYENTYQEQARFRITPVAMEFTMRVGLPAELKITAEAGTFLLKSGELVQKAEQAPVTEERIRRQLEKMGDYPFYPEKIEIHADCDGFLPVGVINQLRRNTLDLLKQSMLERRRRRIKVPEIRCDFQVKKAVSKNWNARVRTKEQAAALVPQKCISRIYVPIEMIGQLPDHEKYIWVFPAVISEKNYDDYRALLKQVMDSSSKTVLASNWGILRDAAALNLDLVGDIGLNTANSWSLKQWKEFGLKRTVLSTELTFKQIERLKTDLETETIVYGQVPVMITRNCPLSERNLCGKHPDWFFLRDRKQERLPVISNCRNCTAVFLNAKPLYIGDRLKEIPDNVAGLQFLFWKETPEECLSVLEEYHQGKQRPEGTFTRGHFYNGVL